MSTSKELFIQHMKNIEEIEAKHSEANNLLSDLFGRDATAENIFNQQFYRMTEMAITQLAEVYHDKEEWILWYFYEVRNSKDHKMMCVINEKEFVCKDHQTLWEIIQESKKTPPK